MNQPLVVDIPPDVGLVSNLDAINTTLKVVIKASGMRIALVARIAADSWTCCVVDDNANFGITPGQGLDLSTTY